MNDSTRDLNELQNWMQTVITHPDGIVAGIASKNAQQHIDVAPDDVEQVISRSKNLTSIERMQVYGNAYYARLFECLGDEFPALKHALTEDTFNAFCIGYLQQYPSRSYTLAELGANFPRYLAETRPDPENSNGQPDWADFLIDLATLERTYSEVFDGPGVEGQTLLQADDLLSIPQARWPDAKLVRVECLRLATFKFPVHEYASAVRKAQEVSPPDPKPTYLVFTRRDYVVRRCGVSQSEYELLRALAEGHSVGEAVARAVEVTDVDLASLARSIQEWFRVWARAGYFRAVELPVD